MSKFFDSSRSSSVSSFIPPVLTPSQSTLKSGLTRGELHYLPEKWVMWYHNRYQAKEAHETGETEGNEVTEKTEKVEVADEVDDTQRTDKTEKNEKAGETEEAEKTEEVEKTDDVQKEENNANENQPDRIESSTLEKQYLQGTSPVFFSKVGSPLNDSTETIDSVEQFWQSESDLMPFKDLPKGTEFFFFKKGVKPMWEDPVNRKGGRWTFHFICDKNPLRNERSVMRIGLIWERLLLKLISGTFISEDNLFRDLLSKDICGVTLSVRGDRNIIGIWNTHLEYFKYCNEGIKKYRADAKRLKRMGLQSEEGEEADNFADRLAEKLADSMDEEILDDSYFGVDEDDSKSRKELRNFVKLTPFALRRGIANAMYRVIAEVDRIIKYGENPITAKVGSSEQFKGICSKSKYKRHFPVEASKAGLSRGFGKSSRGGNRRHAGNNEVYTFRRHYRGREKDDREGERPYEREKDKEREKEKERDEDRNKEKESDVPRRSYRSRRREKPEETKTAGSDEDLFSSLGKQRKKLEFSKDGKLVEEVNMLSFGRRRRMMKHSS
ncbi:hypothetical protein FOA43_004632 [Brettanomyces nanus]|uniref:Eukaryotic translation initiation factor 4E n=1 Tax=Eeniella nana TaxID=13502 RepID=A0A875SB20_EENNA|nr:uncharacterized protein FOA43_004632 [Brettanomyces nanus]QPG77225.1 hypothetical protein FOA43_004632 [Brettanomyces nanus]